MRGDGLEVQTVSTYEYFHVSGCEAEIQVIHDLGIFQVYMMCVIRGKQANVSTEGETGNQHQRPSRGKTAVRNGKKSEPADRCACIHTYTWMSGHRKEICDWLKARWWTGSQLDWICSGSWIRIRYHSDLHSHWLRFPHTRCSTPVPAPTPTSEKISMLQHRGCDVMRLRKAWLDVSPHLSTVPLINTAIILTSPTKRLPKPRNYISQLAWEHPGVCQEDLEPVAVSISDFLWPPKQKENEVCELFPSVNVMWTWH